MGSPSDRRHRRQRQLRHLTLDNTGNKVGEQVKDPSGNLLRNITRVYDALNRVQQVTGASN